MPSIHPGIFLVLIGIISTVLPKRVRQVVLVVCPVLAFLFALSLKPGTEYTLEFFRHYTFHYIHVTSQNYIFLFIFALMGIVAAIYSLHESTPLGNFASMGYLGSALGVTLAGDWLTLLFFWELMAVTSLFLILGGKTRNSNKAGFRYIIIHMLGGNALLAGVAIKLYQGSFLIENIASQPHDVAFWLIFFGVAVNAAIVPVHAWVPDAYPESTLSGGVFLCFTTTKVAVLALLQIFAGFDLLTIFGLIMIYYGALFALLENDMRRLLAYHIVSQVGYMVADAGLGGEIGINAGASLAYGHILYKGLLFMCIGAVIYATGTRKINQLGGLYKKMPLVCITFFIAAYSIAGFPPLTGFVCKSLSIVAAEEMGSSLIVFIMMAGNILTAMSIPFKMGYFVFFGKDRDVKVKKVPLNMQMAMIGGAGLCLFTGFFPQITYRLLPFAVDYHPYNLMHILEYVQLLPAALIPFILCLKIMEPHDATTLDTDWFVRKPFKFALFGLSKIVCAIQAGGAKGGRKLYHAIQVATNDPYKLLHKKPVNTVSAKDAKSHFLEDSYRMQIGTGMLFVVAMVIVVGVFIFIKH